MTPPPEEEEDKDPLKVLLRRVERDREARCREILEAARSEAEAIRSEAYSRARQRLHRTIQNERQRVQQQLRSVQAEQATRLRHQRHQRINAALDRAWGQLEEALRQRWGEADGRREWIQAAMDQARHYLPPGTWTLEHPESLAADELLDAVGDPAGDEGITLATQADPGAQAGIRIRCGDAELDATMAGLLVDRERIRSWLLAHIQSHRDEEDDG